MYTCPNERAQVKRCLYPSWLSADERPQTCLCPPASILLLPCNPHTALIATGKVVLMPEGQGGRSHPGQINNRRPQDNILVMLIILPRTVRPGTCPAPGGSPGQRPGRTTRTGAWLTRRLSPAFCSTLHVVSKQAIPGSCLSHCEGPTVNAECASSDSRAGVSRHRITDTAGAPSRTLGRDAQPPSVARCRPGTITRRLDLDTGGVSPRSEEMT